MTQVRQFLNVTLGVAAALILFSPTLPADAKDAATADDNCGDATGFAVLASPVAPWKGAPLRVIFTAEKAIDGELSLIAPDGKLATSSRERHGGPPYFWYAEVASPSAGTWHAKLKAESNDGGCAGVTRDIAVSRTAPAPLKQTNASVWPIRGSWNRATENLYSAWIEKLFDDPIEAAPSWKALHEVLRDKNRNVLFNHLGLSEDEKKLVYQPDCADLPYFLRAYFAFKVGLPYGYSKCSRGGGGKAPRCPQWFNIQKEETATAATDEKPVASKGNGGLFGIFNESAASPAPPKAAPSRPSGLVQGFGYYVRTTVANGVHSGNGRTAANDDNTDYYPVALKEDSLRPGTIYADPYGHVLVLVKRIAQTPESAGVFLAVDGQPDGTVARKRFWRGNFLFAQDPGLGSPGFKRFRPIVVQKSGGLRRLNNEDLGGHVEFANFSPEQSKLSVEDFYDRMDDVMSPAPLDPMHALKEVITALQEQVETRVTSVENGRKYQAGGGAEVGIPDGASIFETTGAWEDFSTPSRDLRLLIAIDVVRGFPERVARRPERYAMPSGKSVDDVKGELQKALASELETRKVSYTRTDGSPWSLTLKDVVGRSGDLEMAYNVNDCVETRWGAAAKSDEAATCKRHASESQIGKMKGYRAWFHERRRPPRD